MYDHDLDDVEILGWEEFIARQWELIFAGYRSGTGLRRICRRWSDLIEVGLGCSQDLADRLVRAEIIDRADRDLEGTRDPQALVSGMVAVVEDLRADLPPADLPAAGLPAAGPPDRDGQQGLPARHARLLSFIRVNAFGEDAGEAVG